MRIAIPYEKETGNVNMAFGQSQYFKIYTVEDKKIISEEVIDNGGNAHTALITHLKNNGVSLALIGNIGQHGFDFFAESNLMVYTSVSGKADDVIKAYLDGTLELKQEARGCHFNG